MKKTLKIAISAVLVLACLLSFAACRKPAGEADPWEKATYQEDTTFGNGAKTVVVEVKIGEKTVTFTVKTDKDTVGAALFEHKLIDGDQGEFGLYLKKVNGVTADYDVDKSYWAFYVNGEYAMTGVDMTEIEEGVTYKLEYTK